MKLTEYGKLFFLSPDGVVLVSSCSDATIDAGQPDILNMTSLDDNFSEFASGLRSPAEFTARLMGEYTCQASAGLSTLLQLVMEEYVKEQVKSALLPSSTSGQTAMEERIASLQLSLEKVDARITSLSKRQKRTAKRLSPLFVPGFQNRGKTHITLHFDSGCAIGIAVGSIESVRSVEPAKPWKGTVVVCDNASYVVTETLSKVLRLMAAPDARSGS